MASDIWLRTILIVRKETRCRHIGYSYRLTARVLLYAPSHRQDNTYHSLCYTSRGALAGTRNNSMGLPHEGSIRRPITPWANAPLPEIPNRNKHWNQSCPLVRAVSFLNKHTHHSFTRLQWDEKTKHWFTDQDRSSTSFSSLYMRWISIQGSHYMSKVMVGLSYLKELFPIHPRSIDSDNNICHPFILATIHYHKSWTTRAIRFIEGRKCFI